MQYFNLGIFIVFDFGFLFLLLLPLSQLSTWPGPSTAFVPEEPRGDAFIEGRATGLHQPSGTGLLCLAICFCFVFITSVHNLLQSQQRKFYLPQCFCAKYLHLVSYFAERSLKTCGFCLFAVRDISSFVPQLRNSLVVLQQNFHGSNKTATPLWPAAWWPTECRRICPTGVSPT